MTGSARADIAALLGSRAVGPRLATDLVVRACAGCGTVQSCSEIQHGSQVCAVCRTELRRVTGRSLDLALACSSATLLLLVPANLLPFLTTSVLGITRQSHLASSATEMWREGWPWLSVIVFTFLIVAPLLRFTLLTAVLGALKLGLRPLWLGRAFRGADRLQTWAMADVFLLGLWVAYARLAATLSVTVEMGAVCFIGAGLLSLITRAALDKPAIWQLIGPEANIAPSLPAVGCGACDLVAPAVRLGTPCSRCGQVLQARKVNSVGRTAAFTIAGLLLYLPANLLPMATVPIGLHPTQYTVLEGVFDLAQARLYALAGLVFTASFAIPLLKLTALCWFVLSIWREATKQLIAKTRLYGVIEEIGRWSMVDPFTIACFVPVMQFNAALYGRAGAAAPAFTGVVVLTMVGAATFDPRLVWDAARGRR